METTQTNLAGAEFQDLLSDARKRLKGLSPDRLRVATDFLTYMDTRAPSEATEELLKILAFEQPFGRAVQ